MIKILYGGFKFDKMSDWVMLPFKIIYLIYTLPFLIFVLIASILYGSAFRELYTGKIGVSRKLFIHFSAIVMSYAIWICFLK